MTYWIGDPNADWGDSYIFNYRVLREWGLSRFKTVQHLLARAFPLVAFASLFWLRPYWRRLLPLLSILATARCSTRSRMRRRASATRCIPC